MDLVVAADDVSRYDNVARPVHLQRGKIVPPSVLF